MFLSKNSLKQRYIKYSFDINLLAVINHSRLSPKMYAPFMSQRSIIRTIFHAPSTHRRRNKLDNDEKNKQKRP